MVAKRVVSHYFLFLAVVDRGPWKRSVLCVVADSNKEEEKVEFPIYRVSV